MDIIVYEFLKIKNFLQIYHWSTKSYERHVASGKFYEKIDKLIDNFVETMQSSKRLCIKNKKIINFRSVTDLQAEKILISFRDFLLNDLPKLIKNKSPDLKNIRDEMLNVTNQTIYLFSLK